MCIAYNPPRISSVFILSSYSFTPNDTIIYYVNLNECVYIYAYGDSRGDKEMLELANESFYKHFRNKDCELY